MPQVLFLSSVKCLYRNEIYWVFVFFVCMTAGWTEDLVWRAERQIFIPDINVKGLVVTTQSSWESPSLYSVPVLSSFFILKVLNIHIYQSKHFLFKISKLCGIFIIWDLDIWTARSFVRPPPCMLSLAIANCRGLGTTLLGILTDGYSV